MTIFVQQVNLLPLQEPNFATLFRMDFAGSSTSLDEGRPNYDLVVGAAARRQRAYNGRQSGDPTRSAQAILRIACTELPP